MRYGSVCSGVEAASVAWHPLGWSPVFFSEIDPFPRAVLARRFPEVPLHGDFTTIEAGRYGAVDVLVGGTPCQSFSVAGKRLGLDDPRGNLAIEYCRLARRLGSRWVVWENVPGVLSANGGRDFGAFLGLLVECGYGVAYRVLDAQFVRVDGYLRAVPQRRRRVFVVGYLGDWRPAAAVLFEREGMRGDPPPRREARKGHPRAAALGSSGGGGLIEVAPTLETTCHDYSLADGFTMVAEPVSPALRAQAQASHRLYTMAVVAVPLAFDGRQSDVCIYGPVAGTLDTDPGTVCVCEPIPFDTTQLTSAGNYSRPAAGDPFHPLAAGAHPPAIAFSRKDYGADATEGVAPTLCAMGHGETWANGGGQMAVAFQLRGREGGAMPEVEPDAVSPALRAAEGGATRPFVAFAWEDRWRGDDGRGHEREPLISEGVAPPPLQTIKPHCALDPRWRVRRLTPRECERLQGFPDDWTMVPWRKGEAPDGPRYKALGNSMAVNVMRWIGRRIEAFEKANNP